ncbi:MAG: hypothetical protein M5U31_09290 [Acidimicrobiia bacterium]|nr:hypothetical protein [Acidimicrobiia bacterium]
MTLDVRRMWLLAGLVALGVFLVYAAIQRGEIASYDGQITAGVGRNVWEHGSFTRLDDVPGGGTFSRYDLGTTLISVPLWGIQLAVGPTNSDWVTLGNPLLLALCAGVLVLIGLELRWSPTVAVATALAFAFLTTAPWHSTEAFAEPGVALGTLIVVLGLLRWRAEHLAGPWLVGGGIAVAVLFRMDSLLLVGAALALVPMFVGRRRLRDEWVRWVPALAVPLTVAVAQLAWYNHYRTGSFLHGPHTADPGFTTPILEGLHLIVVSPGKGLIWFAPIVLLAVPGAVILWRTDRPVAAGVLGLVALRLVFYAAWWAPDGRAAWGPRFLLPACALLVISVGALWDALPQMRVGPKATTLAATVVLAVAGIAVTTLSVWVPYSQVWAELHDPEGVPPDRYSTVVEDRIDDWRYTISGSHIVRNAELLDEADPFPLRHWQGGPSVDGVELLVGGIALVAGAVFLARRLSWERPNGDRHTAETRDRRVA